MPETSRGFHPPLLVTRESLPPAGRLVRLDARPDERAALAKELGFASLDRFEAELEVTRAPMQGVRVTGEIRAELAQPCVVSLEPVPESVRERVDITYSPHVSETVEEGETLVDAEWDAPEPMPGEAVDLSQLAREHLVLGLEPYPRLAGAEIDRDALGEDVTSPFAALKALKES